MDNLYFEQPEENALPDTTQHAGWSIDKRIPLSMFGLGILQIVVLCAWAFALQSRVTVLENTSVTREAFARIDEKMNTVKDDIGALKGDVASLHEELRKIAIRR